jgi:uncharacterized protein
MIKRGLEGILKNKVDYKKAIVLPGPRQVGKTTLITGIAKTLTHEYLYINGDDPSIRLAWNNPSQAFINNYIGNYFSLVLHHLKSLVT